MPMLNLNLNLGLNHDEVYFSQIDSKNEDCKPVISTTVTLDHCLPAINSKYELIAWQFKR